MRTEQTLNVSFYIGIDLCAPLPKTKRLAFQIHTYMYA